MLKGLYRFKASGKRDAKLRAQLLGSGTIMYEVLKAQKILEQKYGVAADVWSVTSYKELYRDANDCERWNMLHPGETAKVPYVTQTLKDAPGPVHRRIRLHEGVAGKHWQMGAADNWSRLAQTASVAARAALRCVTSLKWMPSTSCWRRWSRWPARRRSNRRSEEGHQRTGNQSGQGESGNS